MSKLRSYRRRRSGLRELLPFAFGAVLALFALALLLSDLIVRTEYRYARMRVGDAKVLEPAFPVSDVEVTRPEIARAEVDGAQGLVVHGKKKGVAELTYRRADGKRFHYFVEVRGREPIRVTVAPALRKSRVARKAPERRRRREEPKKEPEKLPDARPKGQVVEIDKPAVQERPSDAKYLSEYDSKVKEETRARQRSLSPRSAPGPPIPPRPATRRGPAERRTATVASAGSRPRPRTRDAELPRLGRTARPQPPAEPQPAEPGLLRPQAPGGPERIDVTPRPEVIAQAAQGGAFPDHLKGVKPGDRTFLNTKEWKGASFFNRVKRAVAQNWNPGEVYRRRDPYGNIYGIKDRYTLVHVTLYANGSLKQLKVIQPSGIDFLDEEALGALEAAQPYPNPPPEVRDKDGLIRFSFGFYFEVSDRPLFRIYRYND